jgi:hypothetical protein
MEEIVLNPHHRHISTSPDCPTPIIHCYKKVISTLITLPITPPRLYFTSSLAKALHHQSSNLPPSFPHHHPMLIITPHNDTHDNELADSLSLSEQLIDM